MRTGLSEISTMAEKEAHVGLRVDEEALERIDVKLVPNFVYWLTLLVAVIGVSSAGSMFQEVDEVSPILRASYRLQVTSIVLVIPAVVQWCQAKPDLRAMFVSKKSLFTIFMSGLFVGAHFACWVASLDLTTLTHSLLFVTSHPLVIVVGMLVGHRLHKYVVLPLYPLTEGGRDACEQTGLAAVQEPSRVEIFGACLGFTGAGLTLLDMGSKQGRHTVSAEGDGLAFLGAVFFVLYMVCGRVLRTAGMPLFVYAFPVTFLGSLVLLPFSAWLETRSLSDLGPTGWHGSPRLLVWFFALALVAGIAGHTGMNFVLVRLSPLVISTAATTEPVFGTLIGYMLFNNDFPSTWTFVGGAVLLMGLVLVVHGSGVREKEQAEVVEKQDEEEGLSEARETEIELLVK